MSCGMSTVKCILFLFNLLCALCGIVFIVFGALIFRVIVVETGEAVKEAVFSQSLPIGFIILGSIILLISFLGCCGAMRDSYCMSMTYAGMMFVLLVVQIIILIYAGVQKTNFLDDMGKVIDKIWENSKKHPQGLNYMSSIEISYKCCGKNGPSDYLEGDIFHKIIPGSCCEDKSDVPTCISSQKYYKSGCRSTFVNWWTENWSLLYKILIGIGVVEIFGILLIVGGTLLFRSRVVATGKDVGEAIATEKLVIAIIVLGSLILLISFLGCCGAIRNSYCMSLTYAAMMFVLLVIQIIILVYAAVQKDNYIEDMGHLIDKMWENGKNNNSDGNNYLTGIEIFYKCCGKNGPTDYPFNRIPASCCPGNTCNGPHDLSSDGCRDKFVNWWKNNWSLLYNLMITLGVIELVGFIFACYLANHIRNHRRRQAY